MGQISQLTMVPDKNSAIAVFTNADSRGRVCTEVTRWALCNYVEIEITDPESMDVDEKELTQQADVYTRPFSEIHLGMLGGRLI